MAPSQLVDPRSSDLAELLGDGCHCPGVVFSSKDWVRILPLNRT